MEALLQEILELRAEISGRIGQAQALAKNVGRGTGGREVALTITNLQQANMWLREASELLQVEMNPPDEGQNDGHR
jgi:hypothetical protein